VKPNGMPPLIAVILAVLAAGFGYIAPRDTAKPDTAPAAAGKVTVTGKVIPKPGDSIEIVSESGLDAEWVQSIYKLLTPGKPPAPPPDNPPPGPKPKPNTPDNPPTPQFGLAAEILRLLALVADSPTKATEAHSQAANLERIAGEVDAGRIKPTPLAIFGEIQKANAATLGPEGLKRWSACNKAMDAPIRKIYVSGKLKTKTDWSALLLEAATALRSV